MLPLEPGDIETNLGSKSSSFTSFFQWHLNGIAAHNFVKILLIESFIASHNISIICWSGTFLDSSTETSDTGININIKIDLQVTP